MTKDRFDYIDIVKTYPWIIEKGHNCILSPDADGMICGLFMSVYLDWKVVGYYDNGKYLILKDGLSAADCIFLDTEIYRKNIKSCGHHINLYRSKKPPDSWDNYSNCLNPNNLRGRAFKDEFDKGQLRKKYPMATIHLLLCIIDHEVNISLPDSSLFPILQPDGTINRILDRHTENMIDWLDYLGASEKNNILNKLLNININLLDLSRKYLDYIHKYVISKKDKIPISSDKTRKIITSSFNSTQNSFSAACRDQISDYLHFIARQTNWAFDPNKWIWDNFKIYEFTKRVEKPGVKKYKEAVDSNFLSLAITNSKKMEYTLENPGKLP